MDARACPVAGVGGRVKLVPALRERGVTQPPWKDCWASRRMAELC